MKSTLLAIALAAIASGARAQDVASVPLAPPAAPAEPAATPAPAAPAACCLIPAGTPVDVELVDEVGSKANARGDKFTVRLARPIKVNGEIMVPAGAIGAGEVIHAAHGGGMGKAGELILAVRYIKAGDVQVPIRGFKLGGTGEDNAERSMVASMAVSIVVGVLVKGGDILLPAGSRGNAKVASDITVPPLPPSDPAAKPPETSSQPGKSATP